ncbi:acetyltransferase [Enterococcus devriesei]|uniref:acetyltransferase n=1 Tax=Enterococcus devriesei TaxID=319970 RepID=UPI00289276AE|nr:acetyltransferase [Enterococcus devriesei]MDT2820806.1 acetyltransferase [Enterococcus devriesei]
MDSKENFLLEPDLPYILIGAGGHAKVIFDILLLNNKKVAGFFDDHITDFLEQTYFGTINDLEQWTKSEKQRYKFLVSIGDCVIRKKMVDRLDLPIQQYGKAIHPTAVITQDSFIGMGTVIMANAVINPGVKIANHCIVNSGSIVEHDCIIDSFVHLSPGVCLAGAVKVNTGSQIGIGAQCIQLKKIGSWCIIGAGSTIVKNIPSHSLAYGTPAKIMKEGINLEF